MLSRNIVTRLTPAALLAALIVVPGCSINVKDKDKDGEGRVDIKTPMGDIHVNEQPDIRETGLSLYAGAKPAPKEGHDEKSANVNISGMGFTLKVVAAEFQSEDAPDKIISYYNRELQRFGKPIECRGRWTGAIESHPAELFVIWGDVDPVAVWPMAERIGERRPDAIVDRLEGVGHYPMVEAPRQFNAALANALA